MASGLGNNAEGQKFLTRRRNINPYSAPSKHIPQRTCVACRKVKTKQELIRLVHTPESKIEIDTSGKKAGRGAYLCRVWECWEVGLKDNRLEHSLRSRLTEDNREQLIKNAGALLKGAN